MKIYFAGSIRGGRDDKDLYMQMISHLATYGTVLTEHVGDHNLTDFGEDLLSDRGIYNRDVSWLESSDVIVAEVTTPSLGVGYELGKAESLDKPILCLFRPQPGKRLSAMISGNPKVVNKQYITPEDAKLAIDTYFAEFQN